MELTTSRSSEKTRVDEDCSQSCLRRKVRRAQNSSSADAGKGEGTARAYIGRCSTSWKPHMKEPFFESFAEPFK